jgi:hypothetical protein
VGRLLWTNLVWLAGQTPASTFPLEAGWGLPGLRQVCLREGLREAVRAGYRFPCAEQLAVDDLAA